MSEIEQILQRVQRIEDMESIRALKARYARSADPVHHIDDMVELFDEDGILDIGEEYGRFAGKEALRAFLSSADDIIPWAIHYMVSDLISVDVDGQTATGSWYLWQLATMPSPDGSRKVPVWIAGIYNDKFIKRNGVWKFVEVKLRMQIMSPCDEGWVKTPWIGK